MGCHKEPKKTIDDVQQDLLNELKSNLLNKFTEECPNEAPGPASIFLTPLDEILRQFSLALYSKYLHYDWDGSNPNWSPPKSEGRVSPVSGYKVVDGDNKLADYIGAFVESTIVAGANLPSWMNDVVKADLTTEISDLTSLPADSQWSFAIFDKAYDASATDEKSKQCSAIIAYTNGELSENSLSASSHIFYFLGVYYDVDSPREQAIQTLRKNAYSSAQALPHASQVTDDDSLKSSLLAYAPYKEQFGYDYNTTPPDFPTEKSAGLDAHNDQLCYLQSRDAKIIDKYVKDNVMDGLEIVNDVIYNTVLEYAKDAFQEIFLDTETGQWKHRQVKHIIDLSLNDLAPVRVHMMFVYWYDHDTVTGSGGISYSAETTYIYFMATVYELADDLVQLDFYKDLVEELTGNSLTVKKLTAAKNELQEDISTYAQKHFLKSHGFDPVAGDPPNKKPNPNPKPGVDDVQRYEYLFEFDLATWSEDDDVKKAVDANIWGGEMKMNKIFQDLVTKSIVDEIEYRYRSETDKNVWDTHSSAPQFSRKGKKDNDVWMQQYASWTWVVGHISEEGQRAKGEVIKKYIIHYLSCMCLITDPNDEDTDDEL